jgi:spoIIIJ-associated protein
MTEPKTSLEIIAPTVEEAILRGSIELGLPAEELDVQILDEGSKGFLGLGTRQVRVRLSIKTQAEAHQRTEDEADLLEILAPVEQVPEGEAVSEGEDQEAAASTFETISELLRHMGIDAQIEIHWGEKDDSNRACPLHVDLRGKDLSILIGRKAETLASLQYMTRLIVGKKLHRPIPIVIDVEGYRARREQQLRQLARRMAQQAIERGRTMTLEPMPANERRIIHIELRDHPQVFTESIGEGDRRKITIKLRH